MGWSNYIVIPKWKLLIEVSRNVNGIEDYEKIAIDKAIEEDNIDYIAVVDGDRIEDMGDIPVQKITIKELVELYKSYDILQSLSGMDSDKLLLYWLKNSGIGFSIHSENDSIKVEDYIEEGYLKIER
jgi:hypothetical protein